ncbi:MAG: xanthine dehydrogenase small subunit [Rhodocyclaceae bacterium]|nr:xanthine dehydrogenase small subunit [Rhodocyclaceae bacterium]MBX3669877.1 xanthine dehydrogenase small subunit [Rhodocyclaceae bacterium]
MPPDPDSGAIRFLLGGHPVVERAVDPDCTVLEYLRRRRGLCGSKEGCAEGDCGACTVVIAERAPGGVALKAVNSCIQFVPALDGKALYTVEHLAAEGKLHPVQQAMVDCHGSQCGFCTPGFVMSLWALYVAHRATGSRPPDAEVRSALAGNLCRCTGYRPILAAAQHMFELPAVAFDLAALQAALDKLARDAPLAYAYAGRHFHAPRDLPHLLALRAQYPQATLLAGGTDVGLWVNKQLRRLDHIIYLGGLEQLEAISDVDGHIRIGAGAKLEAAYAALCAHYPQLFEMWQRFASRPIRNAGTLGGNVANGSPIGDSMPALLALGAQLRLTNRARTRVLPLENFYLGYQKKDLAADEILLAIDVPLPGPHLEFRTYKVAKRYDSDISAVCAAFALELDANGTIGSARVAYGGMAATPARAPQAEAALAGRPWCEHTVRGAMRALARDYAPIADMRASSAYRMQTAQNLLYRMYLETRPDAPLTAAETSVHAN